MLSPPPELPLLLASQLAVCLVFPLSKEAGFVALTATFLLHAWRSLVAPLPRVAVMVVVVPWSVWMLENELLRDAAAPWWLRLLYSAWVCGVGIYVTHYEGAELRAQTQRAYMLAGAVLAFGLFPVGVTTHVVQSALQSLGFALYVHVLAHYQVNFQHAKTPLALFACSFWVLTAHLFVSAPVAALYLALMAREGKRDEERHDVEQPPRPAVAQLQAVAPPTAKSGFDGVDFNPRN